MIYLSWGVFSPSELPERSSSDELATDDQEKLFNKSSINKQSLGCMKVTNISAWLVEGHFSLSTL